MLLQDEAATTIAAAVWMHPFNSGRLRYLQPHIQALSGWLTTAGIRHRTRAVSSEGSTLTSARTHNPNVYQFVCFWTTPQSTAPQLQGSVWKNETALRQRVRRPSSAGLPIDIALLGPDHQLAAARLTSRSVFLILGEGDVQQGPRPGAYAVGSRKPGIASAKMSFLDRLRQQPPQLAALTGSTKAMLKALRDAGWHVIVVRHILLQSLLGYQPLSQRRTACVPSPECWKDLLMLVCSHPCLRGSVTVLPICQSVLLAVSKTVLDAACRGPCSISTDGQNYVSAFTIKQRADSHVFVQGDRHPAPSK